MRKRLMIQWRAGLISLSTVILLSGCSLFKDEVEPKSVNLTILSSSDKNNLQPFITAYKQEHPEITFKVVETSQFGNPIYSDEEHKNELEKYKAEIATVEPDLFFGTTVGLAEAGMLLPLDPLIKQSGFDLENLNPNIVARLRQYGNGTLYALSPTFYANALLYDKAMFDQYRIAYPTNNMTWDELLLLAHQFAGKSANNEAPKFGLNQSRDSFARWVQSYAKTNQVSLFDAEKMQATVNTNEWRDMLERFLNAIQAGAIATDLNANSAMRIMPFTELIAGGYNSSSDNWELATAPVNPAFRTETLDYLIFSQLSISASCPHIQEAWAFIQYVNSEKAASLISRTSKNLLTRTAHNKQFAGKSLDAFAALAPGDEPKDTALDLYTVSELIYGTYKGGLMDEQAVAVLAGNQTIDGMIDVLQQAVQAELDQIVMRRK